MQTDRSVRKQIARPGGLTRVQASNKTEKHGRKEIVEIYYHQGAAGVHYAEDRYRQAPGGLQDEEAEEPLRRDARAEGHRAEVPG